MTLVGYPFLGIFGTMLLFFLLAVWLWLLFAVLVDVFRRGDIGAGAKVLWVVFVIVLPFIGVFSYQITQNTGMTQRHLERQRRR
jgi:predicted PurR-regulated permease PerM